MTSYKILITSAAKKETKDAAIYYETISQGLGLSFLKEVELKYDSIKKNPFTYSFIDIQKVLRDVQIKRFPYVIIYKVEPGAVLIVSVHHTHKKRVH